MAESLAITQYIDIHASRLQVWEVLLDLAAYNDWNRHIRVEQAPSRMGVGAQARFCAAPGAPHERMFIAEFLQVAAPAVLEWRGGEPGVFQGMHHFELQELGPNQTRLVNSEAFSGEMAVAILHMSRAVLEEEFSAFNRALKMRVETGR
ncbi:MAG: SRPBCC domain-containing protein [Chloroflexales bacterium]|nr:SRPBCC domain-containing protein [Chloroflexales bacterium]